MKYTYTYPRLATTVDVVLFNDLDLLFENATKCKILLIKRKNDPFKEYWALPGGYVEMNEKIADAAVREVLEETGVDLEKINPHSLEDFDARVHFVSYFDVVDRDPRERTISFAFWADGKNKIKKLKAGDDAGDAKWFSVDHFRETSYFFNRDKEKFPKLDLAFDHEKIIHTTLEKVIKC